MLLDSWSISRLVNIEKRLSKNEKIVFWGLVPVIVEKSKWDTYLEKILMYFKKTELK